MEPSIQRRGAAENERGGVLKVASTQTVLRGREVAFTGRLASMTRAEAAELVSAHGGRFAVSPTRHTAFLVVGQEGWPLQADGRLTRKLIKATALEKIGAPIAVITEEVFLGLLGLDDRLEDIHRIYTTGQVSRILGLPGSTIRAWTRARLIEPVRTTHRISYFDFRQIAGAKAICELVRAGIPTARIRKSLEGLRGLRLGAEEPLFQLALIEEDGRLLARLRDGLLLEPGGQLCFDFSPPGARTIPLEAGPRSAAEWFERAIEHEEAGRLSEAERAYAEAAAAGADSARGYCPGPELPFNHGNVLYALGRKEEASAKFRQAVGLEPTYAEAWNNLANALAELGRLDEAVAAYQRALLVEPGYADAHFNLAETLHQMGFAADAVPHWRAYLKQDARSAWARRALSRLADAEKSS
jgi:DNA-binding transcriptional MerR regulator